MSAEGAQLARMSGSGATTFALFNEPATAAAAAREISLARPGWWVVATTLFSRETDQ
jgi:4-diphosphocytidyl-2-C-methyl-D-erythritol kinase